MPIDYSQNHSPYTFYNSIFAWQHPQHPARKPRQTISISPNTESGSRKPYGLWVLFARIWYASSRPAGSPAQIRQHEREAYAGQDSSLKNFLSADRKNSHKILLYKVEAKSTACSTRDPGWRSNTDESPAQSRLTPPAKSGFSFFIIREGDGSNAETWKRRKGTRPGKPQPRGRLRYRHHHQRHHQRHLLQQGLGSAPT